MSETCCTCGLPFAMPDWLQTKARQEGLTFYCPVGHPQVYRDNEIARLRKAVEKETMRADALRRDVEEAKRQTAVVEARLAKESRARARSEKRARAGVCLDCNRTFADVGRHRAIKHSDPAVKAAAVCAEKAHAAPLVQP